MVSFRRQNEIPRNTPCNAYNPGLGQLPAAVARPDLTGLKEGRENHKARPLITLLAAGGRAITGAGLGVDSTFRRRTHIRQGEVNNKTSSPVNRCPPPTTLGYHSPSSPTGSFSVDHPPSTIPIRNSHSTIAAATNGAATTHPVPLHPPPLAASAFLTFPNGLVSVGPLLGAASVEDADCTNVAAGLLGSGTGTGTTAGGVVVGSTALVVVLTALLPVLLLVVVDVCFGNLATRLFAALSSLSNSLEGIARPAASHPLSTLLRNWVEKARREDGQK